MSAEMTQDTGSIYAGKAPLEDLMVAMDVVDMVRHQQSLVDRELDAEARRTRLAERLRKIYTAQGIEVSDNALEKGIRALEEERFKYTPVSSNNFSVKLAKLYVRRGSWLKSFLVAIALFFSALVLWYFIFTLPAERARSQIPQQLENTYAEIVASSSDNKALEQARELLGNARQAINDNDHSLAERIYDDMADLLVHLKQAYEIQIISRPNELSGVWRVPLVNQTTRNYYLIVEAVSPSGTILKIPVRSEEDGKIHKVSKWGVRVAKKVFDAVSTDKRDDGIIQNNIIGSKQSGQLAPEYRVQTTGAAITDW